MIKTLVIVLGTVALVILVASAGFALGVIWNQGRLGYASLGCGPATYGQSYGPMGPGMMGYGQGYYGPMGQGMMGYGQGYGPGYGMMGGWASPYSAPEQGNTTSLDQAGATFQAYVDGLGYNNLQVTEVMEFERNYYAIVAEKDTGIGAMELLLDKGSGVVGPEPGPNMMWNAKYSPMGQNGGMMGMMGGYASEEMTLGPQQAEQAAQRWLDANMPGTTAGDADAFYGYYTFHFLKNGQVVGMLSVQGSSGDVWYHSWHGAFVTMAEGHS
jgi:hypothetical protein